MQNVKEPQMTLTTQQMTQEQQHSMQRSSYPFQHEHLNENVSNDSCVNPAFNHNRTLNSCIPIGQAFPQVLGNITEFRKNLMVAVQTDVNPHDVLQGQSALCVPSEMSHLHPPVEQLERQRQRNRQRMKNLRQDPDFRAQERLRQRQRMFLKRQDPQFREKERVLQRVRVREKRNMIRTIDNGNGMLERLTPPRTRSSSNNNNSNSSSSGSSERNSGKESINVPSGSPSNGSVTVYGTLVDNSQLGQHLLLPSSFLVPANNDLSHHHHHHYRHQHTMVNQLNGDHDNQTSGRNVPGSFNFDLCRNNMLPNCKVCMKLYQDMSKHARGHKRNHRCLTCGRVFRLKQHLKGHMKTHGEKNLSCPHCPYKTCYNFALNRHSILKHPHRDIVLQEPLDCAQPSVSNALCLTQETPPCEEAR